MRFFKILSLVFFLYCSLQIPGIPNTDNATITFRWKLYIKENTIVSEENSDNEKKKVMVVEDTNLVTPGQGIRFVFQPIAPSYIYLFHYSSGKEMYLLFPRDINLFKTMDYDSGLHFYPSDKEWYPIPHIAGSEVFYLIVSIKRLKTLENLARRVKDKDEKALGAGGFLYEELIQFEQDYYSPEIYWEGFIRTAGSLRNNCSQGTEPSDGIIWMLDDDDYGENGEMMSEVIAQSVYIRRFELVHKDKE